MIDVRFYENRDLDSVNTILEEAFKVSKSNFNNSSIKEIVALVDGNVCGYLLLTKVLNPILNKYYYLVDYVCVLSSYHGRGIGKKLLSFAEKVALRDDAMYLQLTCSSFRIAAHKLYESCGFVKRDSDIFRKVLK